MLLAEAWHRKEEEEEEEDEEEEEEDRCLERGQQQNAWAFNNFHPEICYVTSWRHTVLSCRHIIGNVTQMGPDISP